MRRGGNGVVAGSWREGGGPLRVPSGQASRASGRTESRMGPTGVGNGGAPPGDAPLDSCLSRNDDGGAGMTADGDAPAPRPCPGYRLSPV